MRNLGNRRKRFAWLLILVYLPMMLAITFHHHSEEGNVAMSYCYDCAHHIHHDGHFTADFSFMHECLLCYMQSLPYVVPTIVHITVFIAIVHVTFFMHSPFIKASQGNIYSTRAPPAFLSL